MKHLYFAYGANTNLRSMVQLCPDSQILGPAQIKNYKFCFRFHADIEPAEQSTVDGVLWSISEQDLANLDIVEGYPDYYQRSLFEIDYNKSSTVAWAYHMTNKTAYKMPVTQYLEKCTCGYIDNQLALTQIKLALEAIEESR